MNTAMLIGGKFRAGKANNEYDQRMLHDYVEKTNNEFGEWSRKNPNWMRDPNGWIKLENTSNDLLSNPHVSRSMWYDQQMEAMQKDIAKNPAIKDTPEYGKFLMDAQNYSKTGDADGNADLGEKQAGRRIQWASPDATDIVAETINQGKQLGTIEQYGALGNGMMGSIKGVPEENLNYTANALYKQSPSKYNVMWGKLTPAQKTLYNNDPTGMVKSLLKIGTTSSIDGAKMMSATGSNSLEEANNKYFAREVGKIAPNTVFSVSEPAPLSPVSEGVLRVDNNGIVIPVKVGNEFEYTNLGSYNGEQLAGVKTTKRMIKGPSGETFIGLEIPKIAISPELFDKEILSTTDWNGSTDDDFDQMSINPKYKQLFSFNTNKDGKRDGTISMNGYVPAQINDSSIGAYEAARGGQKYSNDNYGQSQIATQANEITQYPVGTILPSTDGKQYQIQNVGGQIKAVRIR